jgi:hypothetical protein
MDIILSASRKQVITLTFISKGVERVEVLDSSRYMIPWDSFSSVETGCRRGLRGKAGSGEREGTECLEARVLKGEAAESSAAAQ